ncbi:MAG: transporter, partial [Actinomycetia bacterium]|nr:transporter [Actinomycetes bacterium]
ILDHGRLIATGRVEELVALHGVSAAELTFDGAAPACDLDDAQGGSVACEGSTLRITARNPAAAAAGVISRLGTDALRLRGVEVLRPSLDSVFLTLTGRRYANDGTDGIDATKGSAHVTAA